MYVLSREKICQKRAQQRTLLCLRFRRTIRQTGPLTSMVMRQMHQEKTDLLERQMVPMTAIQQITAKEKTDMQKRIIIQSMGQEEMILLKTVIPRRITTMTIVILSMVIATYSCFVVVKATTSSR